MPFLLRHCDAFFLRHCERSEAISFPPSLRALPPRHCDPPAGGEAISLGLNLQLDCFVTIVIVPRNDALKRFLINLPIIPTLYFINFINLIN